MFKIIPTPLTEYDKILGKDFNTKFVAIMQDFYQPFYKHSITVEVAKTVMEQVVAHAVENAQWVGAGKNVVDVSTPDYDIDVKSVSSSTMRGLTTEASYLQNNQEASDHFNQLFEDRDYEALKTMFVDPLEAKVKSTKNLHLMSIIRDKKNKKVYYTLLSVVPSTLSHEEFVAGMSVKGRGVLIPMIDESVGKTEIYKPKRRLEIRLNCEGMQNYLVYSHTY